MFCSNCGNKIEENLAFCTECGKSVNATVSRQETRYSANTKKLPKAPFVLMIVATIFMLIELLITSSFKTWSLNIYKEHGVSIDFFQFLTFILIFLEISIFVVGILACIYYHTKKIELCLKFLIVIFILTVAISILFLCWCMTLINMTNELASIAGGNESEESLFAYLLAGISFLIWWFVPYVISYIMIRTYKVRNQLKISEK